MATRIPKGPWKNGIHKDGDYEAIVHRVERGTYGRRKGVYFRIVLWLVGARRFVVTNIYARNATDTAAKRRIRHFCQACGKPVEAFFNCPAEFGGTHICVKLVRISPAQSGADECYSDVHRFLKPATALDDAAWEAYREAIGQKSKSEAEEEKKIEPKKRVLDLFSV